MTYDTRTYNMHVIVKYKKMVMEHIFHQYTLRNK